jgi:DNA primase
MTSWQEWILYTDSFLDFDSQNKIIQKVNRSISLKSIFEKFSIHLIESGSSTDWKYKTNCPFFFLHQNNFDRSPSFGYNEKENRFYCFGCKSSGKAVEFVSILQNISKFEAAKSILLSSKVDLSIEINNLQFEHEEKIKKLLISFANFIREYFEIFQDDEIKINLLENLSWNIDLYINSCVLLKKKINIQTLESRINKIIDYIKSIE